MFATNTRDVLFRLRHNGVFEMIYQHKLLDYIQEKYLELMEIDKDVSFLYFKMLTWNCVDYQPTTR